jgi:Uma2 family endonuclease
MYNSQQRRGHAMATTSHFDARLTYDDLVRMPDDGKRHEIIDGVHFVTPSPGHRHQVLVTRLAVAIANYLEIHPVGEVTVAPLDIVLTKWDVVQPDVIVVAHDQREIVTEPNIQGAPALVIEVLSPGTKLRDLGIKRQLYERGGVREYWIVDANTVAVHHRSSDGALVLREVLAHSSQMLTTPLLPGFMMPLEKLFR